MNSLLINVRTLGGRLWRYAGAHKILSGVLIVILLGAGWWAYGAYAASQKTTQYTVQAAMQSPIAVTVTGSGSVSALHALDLAPKAGGTLTGVYVKAGQQVSAGQLIATVDSTDAQKALRDARTNLASARIAYQQSVQSSNNSATNSQNTLTNASNSGFDTLVKTYGDLPPIMAALRSDLYDTPNLSSYVDLVRPVDPEIVSARAQVDASYASALSSYNQTLAQYQATSRNASPTQVLSLLQSALGTATNVTQALRDTLTFLNEVNTDVTIHNNLVRPTQLQGFITTFSGYTSTLAGDASSLSSAQTSITSAEQQVQQYAATSGGATLDQESAQLNLQKAQNSYNDAVAALANYTVRAPFTGTIASVLLQKFDTAGSGSKVATLITKQEYVDLAMNETDVTSVSVGQVVALTFDALPGQTFTGTVAEVDQIGTVTQNVTNYTVKVGFSSTDARIKPGMTAEATITTASKASALVIPVAALKSVVVGGQTRYYVEVATASSTNVLPEPRTASSTQTFAAARQGGFAREASTTATETFTRSARTITLDATKLTLVRVPVTIGLQNDTQVEIESGLTAGQYVVTASLNASGASTAKSKGLFSGTGSPRAATGTARTKASFGGPGG